MNVEVTSKLTRQVVRDLVHMINAPAESHQGTERRLHPRFPTNGTVEHWLAEGNWQQTWRGDCRNISEGGLGMSCDQYLEPGTRLGIVVELPQGSFHVGATVRYCQEVRGEFMTGLEFHFD